MHAETFQALVVSLDADGTPLRRIETRRREDLPAGEVLIRVDYSSLNYKDALSAAGNRGVTRRYPHTPGIDAAGHVVHSSAGAFAAGDAVLVTGFDLGMNTAGGFGQYICVPAEWVLPLPAGLTPRESMIYGTAGLTAGLGVSYLMAGVPAAAGPVLVTGASGGVGSLAVALLAQRGYSVVAVSGKPAATDFLRRLGAATIVERSAVLDQSERPLLTARWAGVLDTVGGPLLASAIRAAGQRATIACCGNVAGAELPLTVYPFILRGVRLMGIDSQHSPLAERQTVWAQLAGPWRIPGLADLAAEIGLGELDDHITRMLAGRLTGRVVVRLPP